MYIVIDNFYFDRLSIFYQFQLLLVTTDFRVCFQTNFIIADGSAWFRLRWYYNWFVLSYKNEEFSKLKHVILGLLATFE